MIDIRIFRVWTSLDGFFQMANYTAVRKRRKANGVSLGLRLRPGYKYG